MTSSKITTIIPTYKRPDLLSRAISSVLNQTYPHFEIFVCDNASGDETKAIVQSFMQKDSRVKYHCHLENIGMMNNYQFGLSQVNTPLFSFLSDDDIVFPWFFEDAIRYHEQFPEAAFFAASTLIMSPDGNVTGVPLELWSKEGYFAPQEAITEIINKYPAPTSILFNQKIISEVAIDHANPLVWDCDFLLNIATRFAVHISKKPSGIFYAHASSYSGLQDVQDWIKSFSRMRDRVALNNNISVKEKEMVLNLIDDDIRERRLVVIVRLLLQKKYSNASSAIQLYIRDYGLNFMVRVFVIMIRICRVFPFVQPLLGFTHFLRRSVKKMTQYKVFSNNSYEKYTKGY